MRRNPGERVIRIKLPAIDGSIYDTDILKGMPYYREHGIEHSFSGMLKGMILRMPTLARGMLKGYLPTSLKGSIITMPADFLVDATGIIQTA